MRIPLNRAAAALALASSLAWTSGAGAADPRRDRIYYAALRPAAADLYLFEAPGRPPRQLAEHAALDYNPVFSPDGRWVVFCSERRGNPDLYALDLRSPGPPILLTPEDTLEDAPTFSPDGARLAFVSDRDGNADIFAMPFRPGDPEASAAAVNLTRHPGGDFNPAFSPDGSRIAFSSDRDGYRQSEIYLMQADGSQARRLTDAPGWDGSPAWSLDGRQIFFSSQRDAAPGIYRMQADGSGQTPVVGGGALSPAVSPGGRLAYAAVQNGEWRIFSAAPDGSDRRYESDRGRDYGAPAFDPASGRLVAHAFGGFGAEAPVQSPIPGPFLVDNQVRVRLPDRTLALWAVRGTFPTPAPEGRRLAFAEHFERLVTVDPDGGQPQVIFEPAGDSVWRPIWSGDGEWIACAVGPTFGKPSTRVDIWKLRPDGRGAVNLTAGSRANNGFPYFSPDGKRIVFRSGRDGNHEIYLMNADGTGVRRLTENAATDTMPSFSPDGSRLAFVSTRDGDHEIYLMELGEGGAPGALRRVTTSPGFDTHPVFSPDGAWLAFTSQRGGLNDEEPLIPVFNPQPYGEVYALRLADGLVVRLTHNKWEDGTPAWVEPPR